MKRLAVQTLFVVGVGVSGMLFAPACAENDQSIFLRQVQAPPATRTNKTCTYQPDPTQPFLPQGTFDVAASETKSYIATILIGSQFAPRGDQLNGRTEPNRTHVNGIVVKVTTPDGGVISEFTSVSSGFVDPGQNNAASYGLVSATLIDVATTQKIGVSVGTPKLVIANVKAFGKTLGGVDVETGEFQFPIRVCDGCLIDFSTGDDPAKAGVDCSRVQATSGGASTVVPPCIRGQDEPTPCEECAYYSERCRGVGIPQPAP